MNRREFLAASAAVALAPSAAARAEQTGEWRPKKGIIFGMLPGSLTPADRFKLAKDVGFDGVEVSPVSPSEADSLRKAADGAGIRIHSIIFGGWDRPMSSADPEVIRQGSEAIATALHSAEIMGADTILLVPAIVNAQTRYADAYKRSHQNIERLVPEAERRKVVICIEEVWNNFLLSPLEFAQYVDDFRSPWVRAYFDVGNVVRFAWPEDWILTLGKRIRKVHIKDFKGGPGLGTGGQWVNLGEGSINWKAVRAAFMQEGYNGFITTELGGGDEAYLRDLSSRVDRIIAGT